jgi:hypothetical protein
VFYGNIGSNERLDFTVVGPAVNEVARIAAMCRSAERNVLLSQAFADAMAKLDRGRLVSVGRYALRGVERPQELFTLVLDQRAYMIGGASFLNAVFGDAYRLIWKPLQPQNPGKKDARRHVRAELKAKDATCSRECLLLFWRQSN